MSRGLLFAALVSFPSAGFSVDPVGWTFGDGDGYRDLIHGSRPVLRHMNAWDPARRAETYKTFIHLFDFDGKAFITKGAGGKFTHHRGLFIGWNKTALDAKSFDFWHCRNVERRHVKYLTESELAGPNQGRMVSITDWTDATGRVVIQERQSVTARRLSDRKVQLDFAFTLEAPVGAVRLQGDPQHAGFHFRAAENFTGIRYIRPDGAKAKGKDVWEDCTWVQCRFSNGNDTYAVTHMNHPTNPQPAVYSTREYGRFGVFFTAEAKPGSPLPLKFRIVVEDAAAISADAKESAAEYAEFVTAE